MPRFHYTAKRGPTEFVEGTIEADSRGGVLVYLAGLGYVPVRIREQTADGARPTARAAARGRAWRVPARPLTVFTRQFASLVRSQVPLLRTLQILQDQSRHAALRAVLREITEAVRQGETLSTALAKHPSVFSPLYISLVHSGEVSGALDAILEQLAEQAERDEELRAKVRAAFTYPLFVGLVGCATVMFLMTFVMPRLSQLLSGLGQQLPLATRLLLTLAGWMSNGWFWGGAGLAGCLLAMLWRVSGQRGRLARDHLILRVPLLGSLVREIELARFARSFGLLLGHGVSVLKAIDVAVPVVTHLVIRRELERLPEGLRQGEALSSCLKRLSISTPFLTHTVAVGEESGRVAEALTEVAAYYERDAERSLQTMASLLEPSLIIVVGAVVGFIVMAVLLPIFEMSAVSH